MFGKYLKIVFSVLIAFLLLQESSIIGAGIAEGMKVCTEIVIPSLFPFMVFTTFLSLSGWGRYFSSLVSPIVCRLFRLPEDTGSAVFMSFIGGYPVGARMIARLMKEQKLTAQEGERMLSFCVNAGPSFVLTAVGARMFRNHGIGALLLTAHILASVTLGILSGIGKPVPEKESSLYDEKKPTLTSSLIQSVSDSAFGLLTLCAFIVLFSGVLALVQQLGNFTSLLEVTKGCLIASEQNTLYGEQLAAFLLSFGGLSVIFQAAAGFTAFGEPLRFGRFLLQRIFCGLISCGWYTLLRRIFGSMIEKAASVYGWLPTDLVPTTQITDITFPLTICLLAVCAIAALTLEEEIS